MTFGAWPSPRTRARCDPVFHETVGAMNSRRDVLAAGLALAGFAALPAFAQGDKDKPGKPLRILVLGGTGFLGPHFVEAALKRGHKLTLFNRGKTNPTRFDGTEYRDIEQLHGDRKSDMHALEGERRWDAVLDTSAYLPADATRSTRLLGPRVDRYLIVSTVSVYAKLDAPGLDEDAPLAQLADPNVTEITGETYGGLKALCERAAEHEMPGRVIVVRPGLIVGPGDNSDRFTYWPARADRGGEILAPGSASDPTQFIDVRDLAGFLLLAIEQRNIGTYNADAPAGKLTMGALLSACQRAAGKPSTLAWVPADFLEAHNVAAWQDMPAWLPATGENAGFGRVSTARAQAIGLAYRPLDATVADTLAWWRGLPETRRAKPAAGITPAREAEVLKAWHKHEADRAG
jgi:nucleoside-diphosphate-sugar epimerase